MRSIVYSEPEVFTPWRTCRPEGAGDRGGRRRRRPCRRLRHRPAPASRGVRAEYPLVPGHELVGDRDGARRPTSRTSGRRRPRRRGQHRCCGACRNCRRGRTAFCTRVRAHGVNAPGAFAESVILDAERCFVVNDLAPDVAVLAEPIACVIRGLDVLAATPGSERPRVRSRADRSDHRAAGEEVRRRQARRRRRSLGSQAGARGAARRRPDGPDGSGTTRGVGRRASARCPGGYDIVIDATGAVAVLRAGDRA